MTTLHRCTCIVMLVFAFAAGCGDDDDETTTTSDPIPTVATPTSALPSATTVAGPVAQGVTDGSPCSPQGSRGQTNDGLAVVCTLVGGETRWRPA